MESYIQPFESGFFNTVLHLRVICVAVCVIVPFLS